MTDWDDDAPIEQPLTRGQRFRTSIARALIKPGSAATGEQILRFSEDEGPYEKVGFTKALERDERSLRSQKSYLDQAMEQIKMYHNIANSAKEREDRGPLDRDPDSFERKEEIKLDESRKKSSIYMNPSDVVDSLTSSQNLKRIAENKEKELLGDGVPSFGYPRVTNKNITLAALLGKPIVDKVLEERKQYSVSDKDVKNKKSNIYFDDKTGYQGEHTINARAVGKAIHKRKTRNLSRIDKLKERIAPYRIGVYEERDAYGGREEGGWTYITGDLVHESRPFMTRRGALNEEKRLEQKYTRKKRNILSMSASDAYKADEDQGVFKPITYTDNSAEAFGMPSTFIQEPEDEDYDYSHFGQPSEDYRVYVTRGKPTEMYPQQRPYYS